MVLCGVNDQTVLFDGTVIDTTTPGQSEPWSNNNKEILHIS